MHDPKRRLISAAPFRDRVVHHALMNVTAPLFERSFIDDSFANRVGKGTHRALDRCTTYLRRYLLPLDVRQFFPSIDHAILVANLERTLGDAKTLVLCRQILASAQGCSTRNMTWSTLAAMTSSPPTAHGACPSAT